MRIFVVYVYSRYIAQHRIYRHTNFRKYILCKIGYSQLLHVYIGWFGELKISLKTFKAVSHLSQSRQLILIYTWCMWWLMWTHTRRVVENGSENFVLSFALFPWGKTFLEYGWVITLERNTVHHSCI